MNLTKTIERHEEPLSVSVPEEAGAPLVLDPPTEELKIVTSDITGRTQLLSTYIIEGYLSGHFELDLDNPVHKKLHDILAEQGKLRGEPKFSALPIKAPSSEAFEV